MANEIKAKFTANAVDLYACVFNSLKQVYDVVGASWVTWDDANIDNYDIALSENGGGGLYFADFPVLAAGVYTVVVYQGSQIAADDVIGSGVVNWTEPLKSFTADRSSLLPMGLTILRLLSLPGILPVGTSRKNCFG